MEERKDNLIYFNNYQVGLLCSNLEQAIDHFERDYKNSSIYEREGLKYRFEGNTYMLGIIKQIDNSLKTKSKTIKKVEENE